MHLDEWGCPGIKEDLPLRVSVNLCFISTALVSGDKRTISIRIEDLRKGKYNNVRIKQLNVC